MLRGCSTVTCGWCPWEHKAKAELTVQGKSQKRTSFHVVSTSPWWWSFHDWRLFDLPLLVKLLAAFVAQVAILRIPSNHKRVPLSLFICIMPLLWLLAVITSGCSQLCWSHHCLHPQLPFIFRIKTPYSRSFTHFYGVMEGKVRHAPDSMVRRRGWAQVKLSLQRSEAIDSWKSADVHTHGTQISMVSTSLPQLQIRLLAFECFRCVFRYVSIPHFDPFCVWRVVQTCLMLSVRSWFSETNNLLKNMCKKICACRPPNTDTCAH